MSKIRIDKLLITRGLADTEKKAAALVMSGVVLVDDRRVEKPSESFSEPVNLRIKGEENKTKYVGRGGLKLEKALEVFHIRPTEYVCIDIGSSTGGFTDCLLQSGAKKVYAIDVGTNQLDWTLRRDDRVDVREQINARHLRPEDFEKKADLIVVDVSFISLKKILPAVRRLMKNDGRIICLIKPQFEVPRKDVGEGGVVT
ncbi:MAG: TlyA family RNA methyltransferase, partial [Pyrinomonadaceae bacterium]|nr:TlyA family RNA methyltransferase [Pyrinomonadaceae bacterium]